MLVRQVGDVYGETGASPHELEVELAFLLSESLFEYTPEHLHDAVVFTAARVRSDRLECFNVKSLFSTSSDLDLVPLHEAQYG